MYAYIDSNGNKGILSGILDIPQYTMAQYTALSVKPEYWICTDYDSSSVYGIDSANVKYGNTSVEAKLDTIDVVDNIKYVRGSISLSSGSTYQEFIINTINAISTDGKLVEFDVNILRSGNHKFSGYLYSNKQYGAGIYIDVGGTLLMWRRYTNNNVTTDYYYDITKTLIQ